MLYNCISCFMYLSSAVYLALATKFFLWPIYIMTAGFDVYPAMTAAYVSIKKKKKLLFSSQEICVHIEIFLCRYKNLIVVKTFTRFMMTRSFIIYYTLKKKKIYILRFLFYFQMLSVVVGLLHGVDAYYCLKEFRGQR